MKRNRFPFLLGVSLGCNNFEECNKDTLTGCCQRGKRRRNSSFSVHSPLSFLRSTRELVRLETKNHGESKNVAIMTRRNKAFFKPQARLSLIFCGETNPLSPPRGWLIENQTVKETESNGMRSGNLRPNLKLNPLLCELSVALFPSVLSTPSDSKHLKN